MQNTVENNTEADRQNHFCRCEQCGKPITSEEYNTHGCVCFDCWLEDETGFKD